MMGSIINSSGLLHLAAVSWLCIGCLLTGGTPAQAGVHVRSETFAPLPAKWRGFLLDHRALLSLANPGTASLPATLYRKQYEATARKLQEKNTRTADEEADLGGVLIRLGRAEDALTLLRQASRKHPDHFAIWSNLGSAWQLCGNWEEAGRALEQAARQVPRELQAAEQLHRQWVRLRRDVGSRPKQRDDLLPPLPLQATDWANLQQLALWFPAEPMWLWQLAEAAYAAGDPAMANRLLEGAVGEFGLGVGNVRERRRLFQTAAEEWDKLPEEEHSRRRSDRGFTSPRAWLRKVDKDWFPKPNRQGVIELPWEILEETNLAQGFPPKFPDMIRQTEGKRVLFQGFARAEGDDNREFLLVENPIGCWYCDIPEQTGLIRVQLREEAKQSLARKPVRIVGTWEFNTTDPEDYLFRLKDARVEPID